MDTKTQIGKMLLGEWGLPQTFNLLKARYLWTTMKWDVPISEFKRSITFLLFLESSGVYPEYQIYWWQEKYRYNCQANTQLKPLPPGHSSSWSTSRLCSDLPVHHYLTYMVIFLSLGKSSPQNWVLYICVCLILWGHELERWIFRGGCFLHWFSFKIFDTILNLRK